MATKVCFVGVVYVLIVQPMTVNVGKGAPRMPPNFNVFWHAQLCRSKPVREVFKWGLKFLTIIVKYEPSAMSNLNRGPHDPSPTD